MRHKREVTVHVTPVSRKSSLSEEAVNSASGANQWLCRICAAIICAEQIDLSSTDRRSLHYPNIEDMPDVTSVDKIVEVKRVSLV
jgi:hypothetical protein